MKLLSVLIPIAIADSLNPVTIAAQVYLLSTQKPVIRVASYIVGVFATYYTGGFLIVLGLGKIIQDLFANPGPIDYILQFIIGILLVIFGYKIGRPAEQTTPLKQPRSLKSIHTFLLGFAVTVSDLPTALPYLAALERIVQAKLDLWKIALTLLLYNLLYVLPLFVLLGLYLMTQERSARLLQEIGHHINKWNHRLTVAFFYLIGTLLIIDSIAFFWGRPIL